MRSRVANHAPGGWLPFLVAGSAGVGGARWGACPAGRRLTLPFRNLLGGLLPLLPAYPAFSFISCPIPPTPFPAGRGRSKVYFAGGFAPGTPALDRSRHLQTFPNRSPAQRGARGLPPEWQEMLSFGQCRQPRRGGTGGEELRRLRWSSPPGQGEQVPRGGTLSRVPQRFSLPPQPCFYLLIDNKEKKS